MLQLCVAMTGPPCHSPLASELMGRPPGGGRRMEEGGEGGREAGVDGGAKGSSFNRRGGERRFVTSEMRLHPPVGGWRSENVSLTLFRAQPCGHVTD